jgi:hypothetical protein
MMMLTVALTGGTFVAGPVAAAHRATPDPAAHLLAARGEIWLTNEITDPAINGPSWNWGALP